MTVFQNSRNKEYSMLHNRCWCTLSFVESVSKKLIVVLFRFLKHPAPAFRQPEIEIIIQPISNN